MKKILLVMCLCLLTLCFLVACENKNSQSQNNVDQNPAEEDSNNTSEKDDIFSDYQDILDTISLLHSQGDAFDTSKYADLDERESAIYNSLSHFICGGSSYCVKDINNDGIVELIMLTEAWELKGLFTLKDGLPILIEKCDNGGIGKDGKIRAEFIEKTSEYKKTEFRLKTLDNHTLLCEIELEETDFYDDAKNGEYYQIINGERFEKNYYDFVNLKIEYSFRDYHNLTSSAGIFYTRLLDIPVLRYQGKYYSMSSLSNSEGAYTYFLDVYDKDGNTVLSCDGNYLSAYEIEVNDQETVVSIFYGKGVYKYYSVIKDQFSNEFRDVLDTNGVLVACVSGEGAAKRLVVQDIFDESRFYKCYDHEAVKTDNPTARFNRDGKSINLEYRLNDAKNGTTRVLCLEMLPILKTKKICYIRFEPSILSECYMSSSGVRAVLRADTHDTVRLLSDGAIIGGEYKSDDGTVRNDWYCINYRDDIYYVTADSFEIDHQLDIPVDENRPYDLISKQERLSWKNKIVTVISNNDLYEEYEVLNHWSLGMALMDMNLDGTPELIAASSGGSMGNVCLEVYDLESGERLCILGDTPHYNDWDNVYLCVHRDNEGNYFIVNEGALRVGLDRYMITSSLNDQLKFDTIFEEVKSSDDDIQYYCDGKEVNKAEFEKQKAQLKNYEISETQMKIIYWEDIGTETESAAISAMADALVGSHQQFIDYRK